jgi:hypothetical protein
MVTALTAANAVIAVRRKRGVEKKSSENLLNELKALTERAGEKKIKQLNPVFLERLGKRLFSFAEGCQECEEYLLRLSEHIEELKDKDYGLEKQEWKQHRLMINEMVAHLQKKHKLVTEGYYLSIYMCLGMSIGFLFGQVIFDNIALGLPFGLGIGVAIGSALDADAEKKGLTI